MQWQRRLAPQQHRAGSPEAPPAESTRTSGNTPNAFATPCTATASESAVGKKRAAPSDLSTAGPAGATNNEDVPAEVFPLNNSYSSKSFESQENNATSSNQNDRHELLRNLGAHLEGLQHEVRTYSAFLRYKLAAADYLRSVLINRSLSADTNPPDHGTHCTASDSLSSHQPCVSTGPECANNPYLKRLREAEAGYLVPVTSRSENSTAAQNLFSMSHDPWCKDAYSSLETLERSPAACAIILHSLHFIPQQPGRHCVEVCAFISNIHLTSAVYDMHLSAYMDNCNRTAGDRKGSVNVSCMSAKVDVLQPDKQCCVRALVHLPANTFTATQSAEVVLRISVHWRDRVGLAEGHADCSVGRYDFILYSNTFL